MTNQDGGALETCSYMLDATPCCDKPQSGAIALNSDGHVPLFVGFRTKIVHDGRVNDYMLDPLEMASTAGFVGNLHLIGSTPEISIKKKSLGRCRLWWVAKRCMHSLLYDP